MTSWLPKDLKESFDSENWQAEADQVIKGVTDRVKQATDTVQQAAEPATSGVSKLVTGLAGMWGEPEEPPALPSTPAPTTPAANVAPAAMPTARRFLSDGTEVGNTTIEDGRTTPRYDAGGDIDNSSRESFIRSAYPHALQAADGDPALANQLLATAISENGKVGTGRSLGEMGFNVGGIQGVQGSAGSFTALDAGRPRQFAAYNNLSEGFRAVRDLVSSGRYAQAAENYRQTGDIDRYWREVNQAGYSETPDWQDRIGSIRRSQVEPLTRGGAPLASRPAAPAASQPAAPITGDLTPEQAALNDPDKWALCGPVAAVAMATAKGKGWTVAQAKALAQQNGFWDPSLGMHGLKSEADLLNTMGVPSHAGEANWQQIASDVNGGNPVTLSTRWIPEGHYVVLEKYDPQTAKYYVGGAGNTLKKTTGRSKWMSADEILALGPVEGALFMDNPNTPTPSVARQEAQTPPAPNSSVIPSDPTNSSVIAPEPSGPQPIEQVRQLGQRGTGAPQAEMRRQPLKLTDSLAAMWSDEPTDDSTGFDSRRFDEGAHEANASSPPTTYGAGGDDAGQQPSVPAQQQPEPPQDQQQGGGILDQIGSRVRSTLQPVADAISDPVGTARQLILPDPERPGRFVRAATDRLGINYRDRPDPTEPDATSVIDPNLGTTEALGNAVRRGTIGTRVGMLTAVAEGARTLGMPDVADVFDADANRVQRYLNDNPDVMRRRSKDALDGPMGIAEAVAESAPSILPTVLAAAMTGGGAGLARVGAGLAQAGFATGVLSSAGQQSRDMRDEVASGRMSQTMANTLAVGSGLVEYLTEKMFPGADKELREGLGQEVLHRFREELAKRGILGGLKEVAKETAQEGAEEVVAEAYSVAVDAVFTSKKPTLEQAARRIAGAGLVGAVSGGAIAGPMTIAEALTNREAGQRVGEDVKGAGRALAEEGARQLGQHAIGMSMGEGGLFDQGGGGQQPAGPKLETVQNPAGKGWLLVRTEEGQPPEVISRHATKAQADERWVLERNRARLKPIEREAGDQGRDLEPDDLLGGYARQDAERVKRGGQSSAQGGMFDEPSMEGSEVSSEAKPANNAENAEKATKHEYSSTQLDLPSRLRREVLEHGLTIRDEDLAGDGRETDPHVTVKYGLHTADADEIRQQLHDAGPITVTLGKTGVFPDDGQRGSDVVFAHAGSPELKALNARLSKLPNGDTNPIYQPHVTLAYVKPGRGAKYKGSSKLNGKTVTIDSLTFSGKDGKQTTIPLKGQAPSTSSEQTAPAFHVTHPNSDRARGRAAVLADDLEKIDPIQQAARFGARLSEGVTDLREHGVSEKDLADIQVAREALRRAMVDRRAPDTEIHRRARDLTEKVDNLAQNVEVKESAKQRPSQKGGQSIDAGNRPSVNPSSTTSASAPSDVRLNRFGRPIQPARPPRSESDYTPREPLPEPRRSENGKLLPPKHAAESGAQSTYDDGWHQGFSGRPLRFRNTLDIFRDTFAQGYVEGKAARAREDERQQKSARREQDKAERAKSDPRASAAIAKKLRDLADRLEPQIQGKLNPGISHQNVTARRSRIASSMWEDGQKLQRSQTALRGLADAHDDGSIPEALAGVTTRQQIEDILNPYTRWEKPSVNKNRLHFLQNAKLTPAESAVLKKIEARGRRLGDDEHMIPLHEDEIATVREIAKKLDGNEAQWATNFTTSDRLQRAGITSQKQLEAAREALQGYVKPPSAEQVKAKKIRDLERAQVGNKDGDFFPTPKALAERMVDEADIKPGMSVLEPSAGTGNIAEAIREGAPEAKLTVLEWAHSRRELLQEKGFDVAPGTDFLKHQGSYDRILMNPPFSKNQDIEHVMHAYRLLKPGGKLLAIMSSHSSFANDKESQAFRAFLEKNGGQPEKLPEGTFNQAGLLNTTGVNAQLVELHKPATASESVERTLGMLPGTAGTEGRLADDGTEAWRRQATVRGRQIQAEGAVEAIRTALAENREARIRWEDPMDRGRLHVLSPGTAVRVSQQGDRTKVEVKAPRGDWRAISDRSIAEWNSGQLKRGVGAGKTTSVGGPAGEVRESAADAPQTMTDEQRIADLERLLSEYTFAKGDADRMRAELAALKGEQQPARNPWEPDEADRAENARQEAEAAKRPPHSAYLAEDEDTEEAPSEQPAAEPEPNAPSTLQGPIGKQVAARGSTPDKRFRFRYRLANLDDLITSHDDALRENPAYPQSLQPRDRSREEYRQDREKKAKNLGDQYEELLTERGLTEHGPPIVGRDSLVESGNGRVLVLRHARENYPDNYVAYQNGLRDKLADYGFEPSDLKGIADPVLVRERLTPMTPQERAAYAKDANQQGTMGQNNTEKARSDANLITDEMLAQLEVAESETVDTALRADKNRPFIQKFLGGLESNDSSSLLDNTNLNEDGIRRIKDALFVRVFGPETAMPLLQEFNDALSKDRMKAMETGLYGALADIAHVEGMTSTGARDADLAIANDLAEAIRHQREIANDPNRSVVDFASEQSFAPRAGEPSPFVRALTLWVHENVRRSKKIRETLKAYAQLVEQQPDPAQQALFFDRPTKGEIWNAASRRGEAEAGPVSEAAPAEQRGGAAEASAAKPADRPAADRAPAGGQPGRGERSLAQILTLRSDKVPAHDEGLVPSEIATHLSDHQKRGVALALGSLKKTGGFLLADGTGVGKTRQELAIAKTLADQGQGVLIVAPNQVLAVNKEGRVTGSFAADAAALNVPFKLVMPKDGESLKLKPGEVAITSYERLANKDGSPRFDLGLSDHLIMDEAHRIKGFTSATGKAGREMASQAQGVVYATATPTDRPTEVAYLERAGILEGKSLEDALAGLGLRQNTTTKEWYVNQNLAGRVVERDGKRSRLQPTEEVQERIDELFGRMTERGEMIAREIGMDGVEVNFDRTPLSDEGKRIMDKIEKAWAGKGRNGQMQLVGQQRRMQEPFKVARTVDLTKKALAEGRRVVIFFAGVNDTAATQKHVRYDDYGNKHEYTEEIARTEGVSKLLKKALADAGITDVAEIHGGATEGKDEGASRFQNGTARVVMATIESGGTGINLDDRVGDAPRTALIMTPPWSAVLTVQAMGRVWRLTTKSHPRVTVVVTDSESDRHLIEKIQDKLAVLGATVKGAISRRVTEAASGQGQTQHQPFTPSDGREHHDPLTGDVLRAGEPVRYQDMKGALHDADVVEVVDGEHIRIRLADGRELTVSPDRLVALGAGRGFGMPQHMTNPETLTVHGGEITNGDRVVYQTSKGKLKPSVVLRIKGGRAYISYESSGFEQWADPDRLAVDEESFGKPVGYGEQHVDPDEVTPDEVAPPPPSIENLTTTPQAIEPAAPTTPAELAAKLREDAVRRRAEADRLERDGVPIMPETVRKRAAEDEAGAQEIEEKLAARAEPPAERSPIAAFADEMREKYGFGWPQKLTDEERARWAALDNAEMARVEQLPTGPLVQAEQAYRRYMAEMVGKYGPDLFRRPGVLSPEEEAELERLGNEIERGQAGGIPGGERTAESQSTTFAPEGYDASVPPTAPVINRPEPPKSETPVITSPPAGITPASNTPAVPPAPPSAPPTQPTLPPSGGDEQRFHVVGYGYFTGLDDAEQAARLQQIADDLAEYSRSGGVSHPEILSIALAAVDNDEQALAQLVKDALDEDTKKRAVDGTKLRVAALRAFYAVERAQKEADRLAASSDPTDKERLPAAIAALEAARAQGNVLRASRRRSEAAGRELNAHQAVFTARAAQRQLARLDGLGKRVDDLAGQLAKADPNAPTERDRDILRQLTQLLEDNGVVFEGSDPTLQTVMGQIDNLIGERGNESPEADPKRAQRMVEQSEKLADDVEKAAKELGEAKPRRKQGVSQIQKLARQLVDLHNRHEGMKPGAAKDSVRQQRLAVVTDLVDALADEVKAEVGVVEDAEEEIRKRAARGVSRVVREQVQGKKVDKDEIAEAATRLRFEVVSGLRRDGLLDPVEPTVMEIAEEVVRLNRELTGIKRGDFPTVEQFTAAVEDREDARNDALDRMKEKIEERVRAKMQRERKPATQKDVDRVLARGMVGRISRQIDEQLRFPKAWLGRLADQVDRQTRREMDREKLNQLIERMKRLASTQRATWRAEGGEEAIRNVLDDIKALGKLQETRGTLIRRALHKANVLRYAGREMDDDQYTALLTKMATANLKDPKSVADLLRTLRTPGALAYLHEYTTAGMLTSPMTWGPSGINMVSNVANVAGHAYAQVPFERLHDILRYGGRNVTAGEPAALRRGMARARGEASKRALTLWAKGHLESEVVRAFDSGDLTSARVEWLSTLPGPAGWFFQGLHMLGTRPLAAGDVLLGHVLWEGKVEQLATRRANQEIAAHGALIVPAPTVAQPNKTRRIADRDQAAAYIVEHRWDYPEIMEEAGKVEDELLLRTEIPTKGPEGIVAAISRARTPRADAPFVHKAMGAGLHVLFPFVKVAHNLMKHSLQVSPVGIPYEIAQYAKAQPEDKGKHALKVMTGASLMVLATMLYAADALTGGGPDDPEERRIWLRTHEPYSMKINGHWVSLQGLWLALPLLMTADMIESAQRQYAKGSRTLGASWVDAVAAGLGGLVKGGANALLGNSIMDSADGLLDVLKGRQKPGNFLANTAGRFLPASSMLRFMARIGDEYERAPDGFTEYLAAATPDVMPMPWGTRSSVPYRLDEFGHPVKNQQQGMAAFIPGRPKMSVHADDPLYQELTRVGVSFPGPPSSVDGVPITRDERIKFQMTAGPEAERILRQVVSGGGWSSIPAAARAKKLQEIIRDVRARTAQQMKGSIDRRVQEERKQQATGRRAA